MSKKKRRSRARPLAALGCLTVVAALVVGGVLVAPRVKSMFTPSQPPWAGMPWYGPSQEYTVRRGSVSEGVSTYGMVQPARQARLGFSKASGEVAMSMVSPGMMVMAGQPLVELDRAALENKVAEARADLLEAQEEIEELEGGAGAAAERLRLEVELSTAQQVLSEAEAALAGYTASSDTPAARRAVAAQELAAARAELDAFLNVPNRQEQLDYLQWVYNIAEVKHGEMIAIPNPSEQDYDNTWLIRIDMLAKKEALEQFKMQYESQKRAAEHRVNVAARKVAALDAEIALGSRDIERMKLEVDVAKAQAKVALLQEALAGLDVEVPGAELAKARAEVLKAEGVLSDAEAALEDAVLVAPFDGTIIDGNVVEGQQVSAGNTLLTIEDSSSLRIMAQVSEIDVARVREGMEARLSFDSMPGEDPKTGIVGEIPLFGKFTNGLTVFSVPIELDMTGMPLFQGMTANIIFPTATKEDVIVVPAAATFADPEGDYVMLTVDGQPEKRYVTKGISDGIYTEIVEGLAEGETVSVPMMGPRGGMPLYGGMY
jgi:HlyD family secretion protein